MLTAAKEGTFSASSDPCVLFPLAAAGVYPKTRVWGSREKMLHCFSATARLSGNARRGCGNSSGKTAAGSALDNNGNTLTKVAGSNTTTYAWDYENRLSSVTLPAGGGTVSFKYDPFGRRIYKSSSGGTSVYAYDGDNLVEETNAAGTVVARYSQTQNIDEPLAMLRSAATSYYHADGLGSVTSLSNAAGSIANTYTYDSFGKLTASTGSLVNSFQYTARESDTETGLYYYRARYYDPQTGRFLSEDPTGYEGGINYYDYAFNNAVSLIDPLGLDGHTWGPITFYTNQQGMSAAQINAEKAHEKQHRCDFWNGNIFTKPCEFLESRGFAAEIPILQQQIQQLEQQKTLTVAERQELQQLLDELGRAQGLSNPKGPEIHYYCNPPSAPSPGWGYPNPPPCSGFSCLDNR
jgi:RHS repeat-associated protein